jgi:hypothetical protein
MYAHLSTNKQRQDLTRLLEGAKEKGGNDPETLWAQSDHQRPSVSRELAEGFSFALLAGVG